MSVTDAVILAGGRSRRMGRDKALLPFGGRNSLAEYQYRRMERIFPRVFISAKTDKFDFSPAIIPDRSPENSPMIALASIFETLETETVFVLGVDMPLVTREIVGKLLKHYDDLSAAGDAPCVLAAETCRGAEPLCALYSRGALPLIRLMIEEGNHRLHSLLESSGARTLFFDNPDFFANLNRPAEYHKALSATGGKRREKSDM